VTPRRGIIVKISDRSNLIDVGAVGDEFEPTDVIPYRDAFVRPKNVHPIAPIPPNEFGLLRPVPSRRPFNGWRRNQASIDDVIGGRV
jgi:hypothetical protein